MTNAASTSDAIVEVREPYPFPSDFFFENIFNTKLGGKDTYNEWETQLQSFLESNQMFGFINGQFPKPAKHLITGSWLHSDRLVKRWITSSLSGEALKKAFEPTKRAFTAKELWDELGRIYGPSALTWNPSIIVEIGKAYPYPSHVSVPSFVTVKLSGKNNYNLWQIQILCLLKSHQMYGFINGQFPSPAETGKGIVGDMEAWTISDSLVKGWILGSLSEEAARKAVNHLTYKQKDSYFTAKDLWDELQRSYGPPVHEQAAESEDPPIEGKTRDENINEDTSGILSDDWLYKDILEGNIRFVIERLEEKSLKPWVKITDNENTILHVAVASSTRNHDLLKELLKMTPTDNTLLGLVNSDGSTLLHVAAIGGNIEAVDMLVERNPHLLIAQDKEGHIPISLSISNMHIKTSECLFNHMASYTAYAELFPSQSREELVVLAMSCQDFSLANMIIYHYSDVILSDSDVVLTTLAQNFPRELNFWERRDFWEEFVDRVKVPNLKYIIDRTTRRWLSILSLLFIFGFYTIVTAFSLFPKAIVHPFIKDTTEVYEDAKSLLSMLCRTISNKNSSTYHQYYNNSIFEATRRNASTFLRRSEHSFQDRITTKQS